MSETTKEITSPIPWRWEEDEQTGTQLWVKDAEDNEIAMIFGNNDIADAKLICDAVNKLGQARCLVCRLAAEVRKSVEAAKEFPDDKSCRKIVRAGNRLLNEALEWLGCPEAKP